MFEQQVELQEKDAGFLLHFSRLFQHLLPLRTNSSRDADCLLNHHRFYKNHSPAGFAFTMLLYAYTFEIRSKYI